MAQKQFKIGLSNTDKQNMAQDVYERVLALTFNEYDTTTEYEVGDFVVYNDQLYKCIGATSGAWDSTKWQLATLNDLVTDIENAVAFVNDKANVNGNYPTMTVGFADNLTPYDESAGDDQDEPFSFQATGTGNGTQPDFSTGSGALMKEKQGNTVVVNQLAQTSNDSASINGVTLVLKNDNTFTLDGEASEATYFNITSRGFKLITGHSYYICSNYEYLYFTQQQGAGYDRGGKIVVANVTLNDNNLALRVRPAEGSFSTQKFYAYVIDLTQWFGSNDNIPAHLLAHPEDFFRYYQGSLAYNEGELVNANGRYIKCIGMNQWDEEWELGYWDTTTGNFTSRANGICSKRGHDIKVLPNTTYYIKDGVAGVILFYDINGNYLQQYVERNNGTFTTPKNCAFIRFYLATAYGTTYNNDTSINLYYENEPRCLTYEPYEVLTNNDTGTEVLRSAGSVKDSKAPDGTITRRIATVTITSSMYSSVGQTGGSGQNEARFILSSALNISSTPLNSISSIGLKITSISGSYWNQNETMAYNQENNTLYVVRDDMTSEANAKAICPFTIYYELAEPTTEQGTPYSENLVIDDFGSMDFGGTSGVPQGNLIFYPVDYKAFIDTLYKYTDGTPSNIALKSDVASEQSARESVDTQLKNALGGTLRQCLCVKESLDFDNTDFVDLGELNWILYSNNGTTVFYYQFSSMAVNGKILCSKYKTTNDTFTNLSNKCISSNQAGFSAVAYIFIKDDTYADATQFKNAMKGVLLAYEKASS